MHGKEVNVEALEMHNSSFECDSNCVSQFRKFSVTLNLSLVSFFKILVCSNSVARSTASF